LLASWLSWSLERQQIDGELFQKIETVSRDMSTATTKPTDTGLYSARFCRLVRVVMKSEEEYEQEKRDPYIKLDIKYRQHAIRLFIDPTGYDKRPIESPSAESHS